MANGTYEYQSEFARRYFAQGRAEGKAEGKAEGLARAVLAVLDARGIALSDPLREHIRACTDTALLEVWLARAAVATMAAQVLGD